MKYLLQVSSEPTVPTSVKRALADPVWKKAMRDELDALEKNETWCLVQRTDSMNVLSSKWVFKHKFDDKGKVIHHKARLVVVGSN